jgi:hypothetical protein
MGFSFASAENAIVAAVKAALTGVAGATVILGDQDEPRPMGPYVQVRVGQPRKVGSLDGVELAYDGAQPNGSQITLTTGGPRVLPLQLQAFAPVTTGDSSAMALMNRVVLQLEKDGQTELFEAAGLAVGPVGTPQNLSALVETATQSRAVLEVELHTTDSATEQTTFIETVPAVGTYH